MRIAPRGGDAAKRSSTRTDPGAGQAMQQASGEIATDAIGRLAFRYRDVKGALVFQLGVFEPLRRSSITCPVEEIRRLVRSFSPISPTGRVSSRSPMPQVRTVKKAAAPVIVPNWIARPSDTPNIFQHLRLGVKAIVDDTSDSLLFWLASLCGNCFPP
jgi:hypothetical protein